VLPNNTILKIGTPLLFDLGVYLVVIGVSLTIIFALEEAE
jgi:multicomponent Na+:H+ antiporter subunit B